MTDTPSPSNTGSGPSHKRIAKWVILILVLVGIGITIDKGKYYVLPKRFAVVEEGALFRSGENKTGPLRDIIEEHEIATILTLLSNEPNDPEQSAQNEIVAEKDIDLIRIPMPGDGCAEFDKIEKAADIIADESHRPLLVHCAAGVNRTGAAYAAWRMKYHGWDVERAIEEAIAHGHEPDRNPEMVPHLREFYKERILATRPAEPVPTTAPGR